jgi:hypothetical protein
VENLGKLAEREKVKVSGGGGQMGEKQSEQLSHQGDDASELPF